MRRLSALVTGYQSKDFARKMVMAMMSLDEARFMGRYYEQDVLIATTRGGDIVVHRHDEIDNRTAYILQEMRENPWQELAAMCTTAAFLKRQGVKHVTVVTPIWRLGHHDCGTPYLEGRIGTQKLVADILGAGAIDRLVTLTPTVDMLTEMYPIPVVQPDLSGKLLEIVKRSEGYPPVILAVEADVLPLAAELAGRLSWECGLIRIGKYGSYATTDVGGRDVLLYTRRVTSRLPKAINDLRRERCNSVSCFVPWIDNPENLTEDMDFDRLITLEPGHETHALTLKTEEILAEWIFSDRNPVEL